MSEPHLSKEDAINQLYATIKTKFEQDGVLREARCLLQSKIIGLMKTKNDGSTLVPRNSKTSGGGGGGGGRGRAGVSVGGSSLAGRPYANACSISAVAAAAAANGNGAASCFGDNNAIPRDPRMIMVNQLILEYFYWAGLTFSSDMFAMEADSDHCKPVRQYFENSLGTFEDDKVPVLLEIVCNLLNNKPK